MLILLVKAIMVNISVAESTDVSVLHIVNCYLFDFCSFLILREL